MPFHRFENLAIHHLNPHLSTGLGPVLEGEYMYFRIISKKAGTGSEPHYHPNELMTFPLRGAMNCLVGRDRRIAGPGTFVHVPPCARHSFKATEDGDMDYLYIKDRTWTLIGTAQDEALPERARSAPELVRDLVAGRHPGQEKAPEKSQAILDGLGNCYYPMIESLAAPQPSGHHEQWVEGRHLAFGFVQSPRGHVERVDSAPHEYFFYVIDGTLDVDIDGEMKRISGGDVAQIPKGAGYRISVIEPTRHAGVRSTPLLEDSIAKHGAADNWRG